MTESNSHNPSAPPRSRWLVLMTVILAFVPLVLDMTILHVAIPSLTMALGASGTEVLWIIDIYPLLMAGLLVPMGTLSDRVGHRKMLLIGLSLFGGFSMMAAFSPNALMLIAARIGLAIGAATLIPSILATITQTFTDTKERGFALGVWSIVSGAGAAIGPLVGGLLLEHFWWGSVFLVNVPVILLLLPLVLYVLPPSVPKKGQRWPIKLALLLIAGLISLVYAMKALAASKHDWWVSCAILALGLGLLWTFKHRQSREETPMLDLRLFSHPAIAMGLTMAIVIGGSMTGVQLTTTQKLQYVLGFSPLEAGAFMLPLVISSAIASPLAGVMVVRFGLRWMSTGSLAICALSLGTLALSNYASSSALVWASLIAFGIALGLGTTASSIAIMGSVPVEKAGAAGALEGTGYELGSGLGITLFGTITALLYRWHMPAFSDLPPEARQSIGETFAAAQHLSSELAQTLTQAGQSAYLQAHDQLLLMAAIVLGLLSLTACWVLRHQGPIEPVQHH